MGTVTRCTGEDGDEGSELLWRGVAADQPDRGGSRVLQLGGQWGPRSIVSHRDSPDQSGMFPCFLGGRVSRLLRNARSALMTEERVYEGGITEST